MSDQLEMFWFLIPRKDENYQWWWGYHKVRMRKLGKEEQKKYLRKNAAYDIKG